MSQRSSSPSSWCLFLCLLMMVTRQTSTQSLRAQQQQQQQQQRQQQQQHQQQHITSITTATATTTTTSNSTITRKAYDDGRPFLTVPDIFIIGAMKCGTTYVCSFGEKEKHFFDKEEYDTMYNAHLRTYMAEFAGCKKNKLKMDASPSYIQVEEVPLRIKESYTPEALEAKKFILILREPVSRQYSEYQMRLRVCFKGLYFKTGGGRDDDERLSRNCRGVMFNYKPMSPKKTHRFMTFAQWIHGTDGKREISRGHYLEHLKTWLKVVDRSQLYIINFQSLIVDTHATMYAVASFLGLDASKWLTSKQKTISLPVPHSRKADFEKGYLDCHTFRSLQRHYEKENPLLTDIINDATDKPTSEPHFPAWDYSHVNCVNATRGDDQDDDLDSGAADDDDK